MLKLLAISEFAVILILAYIIYKKAKYDMSKQTIITVEGKVSDRGYYYAFLDKRVDYITVKHPYGSYTYQDTDLYNAFTNGEVVEIVLSVERDNYDNIIAAKMKPISIKRVNSFS